MSVTRSQFLRNACVLGVASAIPSVLRPREADAADSDLDALIALEDPAGGKQLWTEAFPLISYQVRIALAALDSHFALIVQPQIRNVDAVAFKNPSPPDFYRKLAMALLCAAVSKITSYGLNALVKKTESANAVLNLAASADANRASSAMYDHLFRFRFTKQNPIGFLKYDAFNKKDWAARLAKAVTTPAFMVRVDMQAAGNMEGARRSLKLILYKLRKLDPDRVAEVKAAWTTWANRSGWQIYTLAIRDEWPPNLFATPKLLDDNPTQDPIGVAMGETRQDKQQVGSIPFACYIFNTYHAEPVVNAVKRFGGQLGLLSGADANNVEVDDSECRN